MAVSGHCSSAERSAGGRSMALAAGLFSCPFSDSFAVAGRRRRSRRRRRMWRRREAGANHLWRRRHNNWCSHRCQLGWRQRWGCCRSRRGSNGRNCQRRFAVSGDEGLRSAGRGRSSGRRRDSHTPRRRSSVRRNGGGCCAWRNRSVGRCWVGRCSWMSCGGCGHRSRRQVRCWARHRSDGCTSSCWCESCIGWHDSGWSRWCVCWRLTGGGSCWCSGWVR